MKSEINRYKKTTSNEIKPKSILFRLIIKTIPDNTIANTTDCNKNLSGIRYRDDV